MKPEEALDQIAYLRQLVDQSRVRVSLFSSGFIVWGVLWVFGYLDIFWVPADARVWTWPAIYLIGAGATMFWPRLRSQDQRPAPELFRKLSWLSVIFLAGAIVTPFLFFRSPGQGLINAYYPFVIGLIYMANGLFYGREIVAIGGWLVGLGIAAVWIPGPWQQLVLALCGGGSLILTGLLLRQVRRP